jgi:hypothetical protein
VICLSLDGSVPALVADRVGCLGKTWILQSTSAWIRCAVLDRLPGYRESIRIAKVGTGTCVRTGRIDVPRVDDDVQGVTEEHYRWKCEAILQGRGCGVYGIKNDGNLGGGSDDATRCRGERLWAYCWCCV